MAQGISSLGNNLGDVLKFFGQQRREKEELMGMMSNGAQPAGTEMNPAPMDLSMFGVPEGADEGTGEGAATPEDKAKAAAAVTKAMRTIGQHAYGYDRNTLETMSTDQLRGLMRRSEYQAVQQEHEQKAQMNTLTLRQLMGDSAGRDRFKTAVRDAGLEAGAPPGTMDAGALLKLAVRSGLPMKDTLELSQALHALSQANPNDKDYAPTTKNLGGRDVLYSPHTGAFQIMPDASGEAATYVDPDTLQPVPGLVNIGGKPVRLPAATKVEKVPESFNKTMDEVTGDIATFKAKLEESTKPEDVKRYTARLKTAQDRGKATIDRYFTGRHFDEAQRGQHYQEIGLEPPAPRKETSTDETPKREVKRAATLPDPALESSPDAMAIKAEFKAGKITKEEAVKRLQALGMK